MPDISLEALELLAVQQWRGNIRELRNVLEQAAMRSDAQRIDAPTVQQVLREAGVEPASPTGTARSTASTAAETNLNPALLRPMAEQIAEVERDAIAAALAATSGNKLHAGIPVDAVR